MGDVVEAGEILQLLFHLADPDILFVEVVVAEELAKFALAPSRCAAAS